MVQTRIRRGYSFPILEVAGLVFILIATVLLVFSLAGFSTARQQMPAGMVVAGVPVGGLSRSEAAAYVEQVYGAPIKVIYKDQELVLTPDQVSLRLDSESMLTEAETFRTEGPFWSGFWDYLWARPEATYDVQLIATYSQDLLRGWLQDVAARYDRPASAAVPDLATMSFAAGEGGYSMDIDTSLLLLDSALRRPDDREVTLVIKDQATALPSLDTLKVAVGQIMLSRQFNGVVMVHLIDLSNGQEQYFAVDTRNGSPLDLTCDVALAGQSVMKVAIMIDFFRTVGIPEPGSDNENILRQTMIESGDVSANFMLQVIGNGDMYRGTESVTAMMQNLGMKNSFMVVPYGDDTPAEEVAYISTPAREAARDGTCVNTLPDYAMQTTVSDLAIVMDMLYQCAEFGGGGLLAAYPGELTQEACQQMVEIMGQNPDGIIMAGIPADVFVSHKHGWGSVDTITDSAIIYSPGRIYVLAYGLWVPDANWVDPNRTFPLLEQISELLFNFYNPDMINVPRQGFNPVLNIQP